MDTDNTELDFRKSVRIAMAEQAVEHPDSETLLAFQSKRLDPDQSNQVLEHLALCNECLDFVRDLEAVEMDDFDFGTYLTISDKENFLEDRGALGENSEPRKSSGSLPFILCAATFFLTTLGLLIWNLQLQTKLSRVNQIETNAVVADLVPAGVLIRGGEKTPILIVPRGEGCFFFLNVPADRTSSVSSASLMNEQGKVLLDIPGLRPSKIGTFGFWAPSGAVPSPGSYQIILEAEGLKPVTYQFQIVRP